MHSATVAKPAVAVVFALNGLALASWMSRLPAIREALDLSPGGLGLLLLALSAGTMTALPLSGRLVHRFGAAGTVRAGAVLATGALLALGTGVATASVALTAVALAAYGAGASSWDVAMNVEAAEVERRLGRVIMPRFHAGFSLGTVVGALVGAAAAHLEVTVLAQVGVTAVAMGAVALTAAGRFLPADGTEGEAHDRPTGATGATGAPGAPGGDAGEGTRPPSAWTEPRTLLVGLVVLVFALTEGIANDWLALAVVDGLGGSPAAGALTFAVFVSAMTLGRLVGGSVIERAGRVVTLRATAVAVVVGAVVVVTAPTLWLAMVGALLWGIGASLGFPMGMTAAADDPERSAARVAVVSSIGYVAFLGGPPLVGLIGEHAGVRASLLVAVVAAVIGLLLAGAVRQRASDAPTTTN